MAESGYAINITDFHQMYKSGCARWPGSAGYSRWFAVGAGFGCAPWRGIQPAGASTRLSRDRQGVAGLGGSGAGASTRFNRHPARAVVAGPDQESAVACAAAGPPSRLPKINLGIVTDIQAPRLALDLGITADEGMSEDDIVEVGERAYDGIF